MHESTSNFSASLRPRCALLLSVVGTFNSDPDVIFNLSLKKRSPRPSDIYTRNFVARRKTSLNRPKTKNEKMLRTFSNKG